MRYLHIHWDHNSSSKPIDFYSELNDDNYEIRKVEIYLDGTATFADETRETGDTWLSDKPFDSTDEINSIDELNARDIEQSEFEAIWDRAVTGQ